jgi:hypothetical protein
MSLLSCLFPTPNDFVNKEKFIILKSFEILFFLVCIIFVHYYRDLILWSEDFLGYIADVNKLAVTAFTCFVIIVEPLFNFHRYFEFKETEKDFYKILEVNFKSITNRSKIREEVLKSLGKICGYFLLFFTICDMRLLMTSLKVTQSQNIYFIFIITSLLMYVKVAHLVYQMLIIKKVLEHLRKIIKSTNKEAECADKLKSRVYDRMLENKLLKITELYGCVQNMTKIFNKIGFTQFIIFQSIKFHLTGDFYWISLVTMHSQIKQIATFGKRLLLLFSIFRCLILLFSFAGFILTKDFNFNHSSAYFGIYK